MSNLTLNPSQAESSPTLPPHLQLLNIMGGFIVARAIYAFAALSIADHLKDGPRSSEELAEATGAHAPSLYRLLRSSAGFGLVLEDEEHRFSLTPLGAALQKGAPGFGRSIVLGHDHVWRLFTELLHSVKTGETATEKVFGMSYFESLSQSPEESSYFNEMMMGVFGEEPPAIAEAYDFSEVKKLIDIGGGTGNFLTTTLLANPRMEGVLYELPHVAHEARHFIEKKELSERCKVLEGSFFESVPEGGDAYILSHIIHDWDEPSCLKILENCRRAMDGRGKLLLVEMVITPGNDFHPSKLLDLSMLVCVGGKERNEEEYRDLLAKGGFRLTRIVPTNSPSSIIEAEPF